MKTRRGAAAKGLVIAAIAVGVLAAGAYGVMKVRHNQEIAALAKRRPELDEEMAQCRKHLEALSALFARYRKENKGNDPATFDNLVPKYLPANRMEIMACPTTRRRIAERKGDEIGTLKVDGKDYWVTYNFAVFLPTYPRSVKSRGDEAPVALCLAHSLEVVEGAGCVRKVDGADTIVAPPAGEQAQIRDAVGDPVVLALRRGGKVDAVNRFPFVESGRDQLGEY
jgi:hypothetical protein